MSNPILIDPAAFAREKKRLDFRISLSQLDGRAAQHEYIADSDTVLNCVLTGGTDRLQRLFLELHVCAEMKLWCQRCVSPMPFSVDETARLVLFADEAGLDEAMQADETLEGMVCTEELAVLPLVEDQILLALPYSPMHESCTHPLAERINQNSKPHPFAVLADLGNSR